MGEEKEKERRKKKLGGVVIKGVKKIRVDQEALGRDP
jgi:hypothetical protein